MSNFALSFLIIFMYVVLPMVLWVCMAVLLIKDSYDEEKERLFKR